jgi:hypothetical protein
MTSKWRWTQTSRYRNGQRVLQMMNNRAFRNTFSVFQVEFDLSICEGQPHSANYTVSQVTKKIEDMGSEDVNLDPNFQSFGINVASYLQVLDQRPYESGSLGKISLL